MTTVIRASKDEQFIRKLEQLVHAHLDSEDFGVNELAAAAGYSRSQLHRKIKKLLGHSASVFIRRVRLAEALNMLQQDEATTSEIAYRVGFHSPSYFHRCFHKCYGITPGDYKEAYQKDPAYTPPQGTGPLVTTTDHPYETSGNSRGSAWKPRYWLWAAATVILLFMIYRFAAMPGVQEPEKIGIAVLPFSNLSTDNSTRFFADGMVDDLLHRLSKVKDLRVISRTSSEAYRDRSQYSIGEIAENLGVQYLVEGSVQRNDNQARINIKLIDAATDQPVWSRNYDRRIIDLFALQSEIALNIATEVHQLLTDVETASLQSHQTANVKAFEMYSLGTYELKQRTGAGYVRALNYFQEAIKEDPEYGKAYAGLAETYFLMAMGKEIAVERGRNLAYSLAEKALVYDPELAEAKTLLAAIYAFMDREWEKAESVFSESIVLNPNLSQSYMYYANLKRIMGDTAAARVQMNKAIELDPLSYIVRYNSADMYFQKGDFSRALEECDRCKEILPRHGWSHWLRFKINAMNQREAQALEAFRSFGELSGEFYPAKADSIFAVSGIRGLIQFKIDRSQDPVEKAECYAMLSDQEQAIDHLKMGHEQGLLAPDISCNIHFRELHNHPVFQEILKDFNLFKPSS